MHCVHRRSADSSPKRSRSSDRLPSLALEDETEPEDNEAKSDSERTDTDDEKAMPAVLPLDAVSKFSSIHKTRQALRFLVLFDRMLPANWAKIHRSGCKKSPCLKPGFLCVHHTQTNHLH